MIELFKSYLTKDGKKVVVLEYKGGKYLCNDSIGNKFFLSAGELLPIKNKIKVVEPSYTEDNKVSFSEEDFVFIKSDIDEPMAERNEQKIDKNFEEGVLFEDFIKVQEDKKMEEGDIFDDKKNKKSEIEEDDFYKELL